LRQNAYSVLDHISLHRARHLPHSPNLALSDFWLFGYLKEVLQGSSFHEPDELLFALQEILREVDHSTLDAVFQEWMIRLQKCIDGNGDYVKWCLN
jgi:hypothetical protein